MKKKLFALAAAMVLTLSMGMTAFAADSPYVEDYWAETATTTVDGQSVDVELSWNIYKGITDAQEVALDKLFNIETDEEWNAYIKSLFETVTGYTASTVAENAPYLRDWFSLELPAGMNMPAGGIDITINAPYAKAGDTCWFLLHLKDDGTWEYIKTTAGDKTLTGKFTSLSPVFVIYAPEATAPAATAPAAAAPAATSTTKAPKTGEFSGIYVAELLALISAAGVVLYAKRQREQFAKSI